MEDSERVQLVYKGQVQGVGFRFAARSAALNSGVSGYVKNLPDGTVIVVAEAPKQRLEIFMKELSEEMSAYISDLNVEWQDATYEFDSFDIRF